MRGLLHLTKAIDPTRPAIGNDGWEAVVGDWVGIHDYDRDPAALTKRYDVADEDLEQLFRRHRIGGRPILTPEFGCDGCPILLTEFGGIGFSAEPGSWGYSSAKSSEELSRQYAALLSAVRAIPIFGGFCYTQFTDTYQEANGLLTMARSPKFPIEEMRKANAG